MVLIKSVKSRYDFYGKSESLKNNFGEISANYFPDRLRLLSNKGQKPKF